MYLNGNLLVVNILKICTVYYPFTDSDCGDITVESDTVFSGTTTLRSVPKISNITNETNVFYIIQLIAEKAQFPKEAIYAERTHLYMLVFILLDGLWLLSAFLLFGKNKICNLFV